MKEQQRRHHRRPISASFRIRDANNPRQGEILFDSVDLSQGGAFLRSDLLLEIGDEVEVTFGIPGEIKPIRVRARVVWTTTKGPNAGMGLEFIGLEDSDRAVIAAFIRSTHED